MNDMRKLMESVAPLFEDQGQSIFVVITSLASVGGREDVIHGVYTKEADAKKAVMEVKRYYKSEGPGPKRPVSYQAVPFNSTPQITNGGN